MIRYDAPDFAVSQLTFGNPEIDWNEMWHMDQFYNPLTDPLRMILVNTNELDELTGIRLVYPLKMSDEFSAVESLPPQETEEAGEGRRVLEEEIENTDDDADIPDVPEAIIG